MSNQVKRSKSQPATSWLPRPPIPGIVPSPTTCTPFSSKTDEPGREEMVHGVYPNDDEPPALNACLARVRNHVTSPSRSSLVAPPPPLKRQPRGCAQGQVVPWDRLRPTATWKPRSSSARGGAGRPLRHLRQRLPAFPATSPQGRSSHSRLWLASGRTSALARRVPSGCGLLPFSRPTAGDARAAPSFCSVNKALLVRERWLQGADGEVLGRRAARELLERGRGRR